jgi:hypothetical protein
MEVSSHSLALGRVAGTSFDVAVFTNLSQDHLDFHADLEDYFRAKASLFMPPGRGGMGGSSPRARTANPPRRDPCAMSDCGSCSPAATRRWAPPPRWR